MPVVHVGYSAPEVLLGIGNTLNVSGSSNTMLLEQSIYLLKLYIFKDDFACSKVLQRTRLLPISIRYLVEVREHC